MIPPHDTSGPALPTANYDTGMSLRDYVATIVVLDLSHAAIPYVEFIMGRPIPEYQSNPIGNAVFWADFRAKMRYIEADSMLRTRRELPVTTEQPA